MLCCVNFISSDPGPNVPREFSSILLISVKFITDKSVDIMSYPCNALSLELYIQTYPSVYAVQTGDSFVEPWCSVEVSYERSPKTAPMFSSDKSWAYQPQVCPRKI